MHNTQPLNRNMLMRQKNAAVRQDPCRIRSGLYFPLLLFIAPFFLINCSKDNGELPSPDPARFSDNIITISDITGVPEGVSFNKVRIEVSGFEWDIIDIIDTDYKDGQAIIKMPADYPAEKLCRVSRSDAFDYAAFWPVASNNPNALVAGFENFDVYNNDEKVGRVYLTDWNGVGPAEFKSFIYYHYANEPFSLDGYNHTINGNRKSFKYELSFRKGWNAYARIKSKEPQNNEGNEPETWRTSIPEKLPTRWRFEPH